MKKRFAFILMMLLLMTQGARADLYFESGGIYYRGELLFNVVIMWLKIFFSLDYFILLLKIQLF